MSAQQAVRIFVTDHFLLLGIKLQGTSKAVGSVGKMDQRAGNVSLLDWRIQCFFFAAANAIDKVCPVVPSREWRWDPAPGPFPAKS